MEPFRERDKLWLMGLPIYLMLLILRHEGSHALSAVLYEGARLTEFSLLPGFSEQGNFVRPHIRVSGATSWVTAFAPYLCDALTFLVFYPVCRYVVKRSKGLWLNLAAVGVLSPFLNSVANYAIGLVRANSDVGKLLAHQPPIAVHAYFTLTLALYAYGCLRLFRQAKEATLE